MDFPRTDIRIAVVIPVYNNAGTVTAVVAEARSHVPDVIVVNDGSTDGTAEALRAIPGIRLIEFLRNHGKGAALRAGLDEALRRRFTHAITMDADGQHLADDIPRLVELIVAAPRTLWIGSRILDVEGSRQPARSRFGRRFGAFWYHFHTGLSIDDTQCGFRAYPLAAVLCLDAWGKRYDYELEVLIRSAWNGIPVRSLPIHLLYHSDARRVSHFRPVRDFLLVSRVNAKAALTRLFLPFMTLNLPGTTVKEKLTSFIQQEMRAHASPKRAATSLAFGVFMAITPIYGFQVIVLLGLAVALKLNRPLALLGVSITPPPLLPFFIAASVAVGRFIVPAHGMAAAGSSPLLRYGLPWFVGSIVLAIASGAATFLIAYPLMARHARHRAGGPGGKRQNREQGGKK